MRAKSAEVDGVGLFFVAFLLLIVVVFFPVRRYPRRNPATSIDGRLTQGKSHIDQLLSESELLEQQYLPKDEE